MTKYWIYLVALSIGAATISGCAAARQDAVKVVDEKSAGQSHGRAGRPRMTPEQRKRMREMMNKDDGAPKVGEDAPGFKLASLDGKTEMTLNQFHGKKPVILFFGSYT